MGVIFHAWDLAKQVKDGLLRDAYYCVRSFAPHHDSSDEATLLANFLLQLMGIYGYFAGGNGNNPCAASVVCDWFIELYEKPVLAKYPCLATVVDDVLFLRPHRVKYCTNIHDSILLLSLNNENDPHIHPCELKCD